MRDLNNNKKFSLVKSKMKTQRNLNQIQKPKRTSRIMNYYKNIKGKARSGKRSNSRMLKFLLKQKIPHTYLFKVFVQRTCNKKLNRKNQRCEIVRRNAHFRTSTMYDLKRNIWIFRNIFPQISFTHISRIYSPHVCLVKIAQQYFPLCILSR